MGLLCGLAMKMVGLESGLTWIMKVLGLEVGVGEGVETMGLLGFVVEMVVVVATTAVLWLLFIVLDILFYCVFILF